MEDAAGRSIVGVVSALESLRRRVRMRLVGQGVATVVAVTLGALVFAGASDYVLRTPVWLRTLLLALALAVLVWLVRRFVLPAARFRPSITDVALRVERSEAGRKAGLDGVLAAGVELARQAERGEIPRLGSDLAAPVIDQAAKRFASIRPSAILSSRQTARSWLALAAAAALLAAVAAVSPSLTLLGAKRILLPWTDASWPKRTLVADATQETVHASGTALALRAAMLRGAPADEADKVSRVWGVFRVVQKDGRASELTRVVLTNQGRTSPSRETKEGLTDGVLFERLIEPGALAVGAMGASVDESELEYWFESADDRTPQRRITLVVPARVVGARATLTPPDYAGAIGQSPGPVDLGAGTDERAAPPPVLEGSRINLEITISKPVPGPTEGVTRSEWAARSLGPNAALFLAADDTSLAVDGTTWRLSWTLRETARLIVRPTDRYGVTGADESAYRFEALTDQPPTATVTEPAADETVLASAVVPVVGEGRDDVSLADVTLQQKIARRPASSQGAPAEPAEDWGSIAKTAGSPDAAASPIRQAVASTSIDLAPLKLAPGDEAWITAVATDGFNLEGRRHDPTRSAVRKLSIISEEDFVSRLWGEMEGVRRSAMRLHEEQERLAKALQRATSPEGSADEARAAERAQAAITERLARERETVRRVQERAERNRFTQADTTQVLNDSAAMLEQAGARSVEASRAVEQASRSKAADGQASPQQQEQAARAQQEVRESLEKLTQLLDRGQDTWALKRAVERLLAEQKDLRRRTQDTGRQTAGKAASDLSAEQQQSLSEISSDQDALASKAAEAVERMLKNKDQIAKKDAGAAKAVEQAAKRAQRERLEERMREASRQVQQNRSSNAQQEQDKAIEAMEQMLDEMDAAPQNRDLELRRVLADLIQAIDALITDQAAQLAALTEAEKASQFGQLPAPMLRLNQNTLAVVDTAEAGPQELAPVAELLVRASEAQGAAIAALRASPVVASGARQHEQTSLERLQRAKEEAEKIDQAAEDREQARKAAALKKAYREALTEQVAVKADTDPLVGVEATRRTRATARALGDRQQAIKDNLTTLLDETKELSDSVVFEYAHKRLDELTGAAAASLRDGAADGAVQRRQASAVRVLQSLIESLENSRKDDDFRENPNDGGGGSGGGGGKRPLVPPIAQLKLLRAMQIDAGQITREAEAAGAGADAAAEAGRLQRDLAARAEKLLKALSEQAGGEMGGNHGDQPREPEPKGEPPQ